MTSLFSPFLTAVRRGPIAHNFGGAVAVQLCLLVSGMLCARLLGPQNRGYLAILAAWPLAVGQLGAVGMALAATYFLSSGQIGGSELIAALRRSAAIQIALLTFINGAIVLGYTYISDAPIVAAACLSLAVLPAALFADYGIAFLLGARRHAKVSLVRVVYPATYATGLVILYTIHLHSLTVVTALYTGTMVIAGCVAIVAGVRAIRSIHAQHSVVRELGLVPARKRLLAFGRKGYVGYLSPADTFRIDQLVVGFLVSPRALGIYVVGAAFTNFSRFVAINVGLSATPEIASVKTHSDRHRAVQRTLVLAGAVLALATAAVGLVVIVAIPILFGTAFRSAIPVAEILLVSGWLLSMKRIAVDAMRGAGDTRIGTRPEIVNLGLFLLFCWPLGLWLGGPGVALALVFASLGGSLVLVRRLGQLDIIPTPRRTPVVDVPRAVRDT